MSQGTQLGPFETLESTKTYSEKYYHTANDLFCSVCFASHGPRSPAIPVSYLSIDVLHFVFYPDKSATRLTNRMAVEDCAKCRSKYAHTVKLQIEWYLEVPRGLRPSGIQTGLFVACWTNFVPKIYHLFTQPPIINHFFILQGEEGRKEQEQKMGKGNTSKVNKTQVFMYLEHLNRTNCYLLSRFWSKKIWPFQLSFWEVQFLITPERRRQEGAGAENGNSFPSKS